VQAVCKALGIPKEKADQLVMQYFLEKSLQDMDMQ
jgi:hypothetical protein